MHRLPLMLAGIPGVIVCHPVSAIWNIPKTKSSLPEGLGKVGELANGMRQIIRTVLSRSDSTTLGIASPLCVRDLCPEFDAGGALHGWTEPDGRAAARRRWLARSWRKVCCRVHSNGPYGPIVACIEVNDTKGWILEHTRE